MDTFRSSWELLVQCTCTMYTVASFPCLACCLHVYTCTFLQRDINTISILTPSHFYLYTPSTHTNIPSPPHPRALYTPSHLTPSFYTLHTPSHPHSTPSTHAHTHSPVSSVAELGQSCAQEERSVHAVYGRARLCYCRAGHQRDKVVSTTAEWVWCCCSQCP